MPDQVDPRWPRKQAGGPHREMARSTANGMSPLARSGAEDDEPADTPLYRTEPDRRLLHRPVFWTGLALIAALACACVVALALGSIVAALIGAAAILATVVLVVLRIALSR